MFPSVSSRVSFPKQEEEILEFWKKNDIFKRSIDQRQGAEDYVFYDGPPFATGLPHYGHLLAGTIKDVIPRYQAMRGRKVERRFGWDCHGLPVEFEMEQSLEISGKREIEEYGVDRFNEACRGIVLRYTGKWEEVVERMGRWVDFKNDYKTMQLPYMESIWWVFKSIWDKGLVYEGTKSMPYCPRCATPLSNFEVQQNYVEVQDPAITIRFRCEGEEKTYFLAWTTTPWTLPSNVALAVGEEVSYVKVADKEDGNFYILAEARIGDFWKSDDTYEIVEQLSAKELEGKAYEPLFPYFASYKEKGAFKVHIGDFVSTEEGTGIVHIAPGFGEEDHDLAMKNGIPVVCPVDAEGRFTDDVPDWKGVFVKDADKDIIKRLKGEKKLVHRQQIKHNYPHCWRCDSALIFCAISTWFVRVTEIKEQMIKANEAINWVPEHLKEGRFGKWLEGARDWAISRNRYWGTPLPIWRCGCGEKVCVGSLEDLEKRCGTKLTDIHKHYVDKVTFPCPKCGKEMKRVSEVLDCWFESGAMPYAQNHYPFENKEWFEANFPADFIAEGLDQTRGWFYTLVVLGTALFGKAPFQNVVVNGLVLAEDGNKMSKRLKNYPEPMAVIHRYGADALRLYLLHSPVVKGDNLKFSEEGVQGKLRMILLPLWNALSFFVNYSNIDNWTVEQSKEPESLLDRWILASLQRLKRGASEHMDAYDLQRSIGPLVEFIEDLTNWYIRRSRRRFWKAENDADKLCAYSTLYKVLKELSLAVAPFVPFLAEKMYQTLRRESDPESVHLCDYPGAEKKYEDDELDLLMKRAIETAGMARSLRVKHKIKIRQPLPALILVTRDKKEQKGLKQVEDILKEELNVKEIQYTADEEELVHLSAKANFKSLGPRLGPLVKKAAGEIQKLTAEQIRDLEAGKKIPLTMEDKTEEIGFEDIVIEREEKEGLLVANSGTLTVALDTHLTPALIEEGLGREFINKVQNMRKEADFEITDRINVTFTAEEELKKAILNQEKAIAEEVLSDAITFADTLKEDTTAQEWDLNGRKAVIRVERAG